MRGSEHMIDHIECIRCGYKRPPLVKRCHCERNRRTLRIQVETDEYTYEEYEESQEGGEK